MNREARTHSIVALGERTLLGGLGERRRKRRAGRTGVSACENIDEKLFNRVGSLTESVGEISKVMASRSSLLEGLTGEQIKNAIKEEVKLEMKEAKNDLAGLKIMISLLVRNENGSNAN